jgi:hypothetical protein
MLARLAGGQVHLASCQFLRRLQELVQSASDAVTFVL